MIRNLNIIYNVVIIMNYIYPFFHGEVIPNQEPVDKILREYFPQNNGVIIEIGAFHPIQLSNSYHFEKNGWDAYCIEPNPNADFSIRKNKLIKYALSNYNKNNVTFF